MFFWSNKSAISSKYSLSSSPTFVSEPWSVFTGRPKSSSSSSDSSRVSVFVFDKKRFESYLLNYGIIKSKNSSTDKVLIQEGYDVLRNQVSNLAKLKHPNILGLVEPLEEHSKNFMFVTEYVTGSLESVFGQIDEESNFLKGHVSEDIIKQRGILDIVQALDFIHNRASSVHLAIEPKTIFINENSDWKVSGLGHLRKLPQGTLTSEIFLPQYDPRVPSFMHLELNYTAPEIVLDNTLSFKNDYFSLGLLIYMLYTGKNLLRTDNSTTQYKEEYSKFERKLASMSWDNLFSKLPTDLRHCIQMLMNRDVYSRYDNISDFLESQFFQDPLLKTLNFLDDLATKNNEEKLVFLKGLVELLPKFPITILQRKFLTVLLDSLDRFCKDSVVDSACVSVNVQLLIKIGATLSQLTFQEKVLPILLNKSNFPIILQNATLTIIENLAVLKEKTKKNEFLEGIAKPLLSYTFKEKGNGTKQDIAAQENLLDKVSLICDLFDFLTAKNFLMPLLSDLFTKTVSLTVKIACISCFQVLIEKKQIDMDIICDDILPLFKSMKTREIRIMMQSLKFYETVPQIVKKETVLVEQLLPLVWSYSLAPSLQTNQYEQYCRVINKLSNEIQKSHLQNLPETNNSVNLDGSNGFKNLIEPKVVKKEDTDTKEAKSIGVPAIQPKKKQSILAPRTKTRAPQVLASQQQSRSRTISMAPQRGAPRDNIAPPPATTKSPTKSFSSRKSDDFDDFDNFVSASNSPASRQLPSPNLNTSYGTTPTTSRSNPSYNESGRISTNSSLPPGFSVSLLPSRKAAAPGSQEGTNTGLSNSTSLI